jgi:regulator of replication initiation timing
MVACKIIIKHSASACNKELLSFLLNNIAGIKKRHTLKVLIVYDNEISTVKGKLSRLPALITSNGKVFTGNSDIRGYLSTTNTSTKKTEKQQQQQQQQQGSGDNELENFWHSEMHSKDEGGGEDDESDLMEAVKQRALQHTIDLQEKNNKSAKKKRAPPPSAHVESTPKHADNVKISDMTTDPMMAKFWENQEETPM